MFIVLPELYEYFHLIINFLDQFLLEISKFNYALLLCILINYKVIRQILSFQSCSKAVVPVLVLLFVALWFILPGDLLYVFPCVILFLCFSPFSIAITSLWGRES